MPLRFITGGSGQGKTRFIIEEVITRSRKEPDRQFYVIVPEQFSLEMQKNIVSSHPDHGTMNIDVLSFFRLAYRVFDECGYQPDDILEDLGVVMILRKLLSENRDLFPDFSRNRSRAGFIDELKSALMELIGYDISPAGLLETGEKLEGNPALSRKCCQLSHLVTCFEKSIEGRYMVTEQILHVLCDFVPESGLLSGAVFYFDGYTGFTPDQLLFLKELLTVAHEVNITVTIPGEEGIPELTSEEDLFHFSNKTIRSLIETCRQAGSHLEEPVCLSQELPPRFADSPELAWLEKNLFRAGKKAWVEEPDHIHLVSCPGPEQEAEYILHKVEYMVRRKGYRYRDFAVLTADLGEYMSSFERQARILGIPLFTDTKKKMSYHPSVETLRALFQMAQSDYSYESVFRYLKSGMSGIDDQDVDYLENYVIAAGIRGYYMWSRPFSRRLMQADEERISRLERLRQQLLSETEEFCLAWKNPRLRVSERLTALYEQMCRLDFPVKLTALADEEEEKGDYVKEKEYREIFSLLVSLLDKIVDIYGGDMLPPAELSEMIDAGMDALGLGVVPLSMDQMILGDLKRTRLPDIRVLFIAGMNDGLIPPPLSRDGILTDEDKEILSGHGLVLAGGADEQILEDEFYMYLAFTRPGEDLFFTWSELDRQGKSRFPSALIKELTDLFPRLMVRTFPDQEKRVYFNTTDSREYLLRSFQPLLDKTQDLSALSLPQKMLIRYWKEKSGLSCELARYAAIRDRLKSVRQLSPALSEGLYGSELKGSVTRFEQYCACPYAYFCLFGLGLREREEFSVHPVDIGNIFHKALQIFSEQVQESEYSWKTLPDETAQSLITSSLDKAVDEGSREMIETTARTRYILLSVRRILERTVKVFKNHLRSSDLEPDRFELHFSKMDKLESVSVTLDQGHRMFLEGYVDRVDVYEDSQSVIMRVIDYKSGKQTFDMNDFYHGLKLQLVVYMKAAGEIYERNTGKPVIPAGIYYYQLKDPVIKADDYDEAALEKEFRMSGYTNSSPEVLERIEHDRNSFISASVRLTKDGVPYKNDPVLSTEGFQTLKEYADRKIRMIGGEILEGRIEAAPYRMDKKTACDYCSYLSVCGFDLKEGRRYRDWKKLSGSKAFEAVRKQVEG